MNPQANPGGPPSRGLALRIAAAELRERQVRDELAQLGSGVRANVACNRVSYSSIASTCASACQLIGGPLPIAIACRTDVAVGASLSTCGCLPNLTVASYSVDYALLTCQCQDAVESDRASTIVIASREIAAPADKISNSSPIRRCSRDGTARQFGEARTGQRVRATVTCSRRPDPGQRPPNHVVESGRADYRVAAVGTGQGTAVTCGEAARALDDSRTLVTHTYDWSRLTDETRLPRARATTADKLKASIDSLPTSPSAAEFSARLRMPSRLDWPGPAAFSARAEFSRARRGRQACRSTPSVCRSVHARVAVALVGQPRQS